MSPLGSGEDPHSWDLCGRHVERLTVPEGWELVREDPTYFGTLGSGVADSSDFTDEEMEMLAAALEAAVDGPEGPDFTGASEPAVVHAPTPASKIIRREDIPRPSGHHPSRGNLPRRTPPRHLRAVRDND